MIERDFDAAYAEEFGVVCGTDEAGRGPLAGPVVAAAVVLPKDFILEGLDDSKKLSEKKRDALYDKIIESAVAYGIASSSEAEIDEYNILAASLLAMRRSVAIVTEKMGTLPGVVLVDGNRNTDFGTHSIPVVKGDAISQSIAAASILAKVTRDRIMAELAPKYPEYNLEVHKGYPTPAHKLAVYEFGPSPIHRKSFLSFLKRDREKLEAALKKKRERENG